MDGGVREDMEHGGMSGQTPPDYRSALLSVPVSVWLIRAYCTVIIEKCNLFNEDAK
jgi:hypothetical protein